MKYWWSCLCVSLFFLAWVACSPVVTQPTSEQRAESTQDSGTTHSETSVESTGGLESSPCGKDAGCRDTASMEKATQEAPLEPTPEPVQETQPDGGSENLPEQAPESLMEKTPDASGGFKCDRIAFDWEGRKRLYILCTPSPLPAAAMPVIFGFHGGGGNAGSWLNAMPLHQLGAKEGFASVFMQGCADVLKDCSTPGKYFWNIGKKGLVQKVNDQSFVKEVLRRLTVVHKLKIDTRRLFATGHSMGGMFSYSLWCDQPGLFAAIGPLSGPPTDATCKVQSHASIFHAHGAKDLNVPFARGCCSRVQKTRGHAAYLSGCATLPLCNNPINWWPPVRTGKHPYGDVVGLDEMASEGLGCENKLQEIYRKGSVLCYAYQNCKQGKRVEACLLLGVDHSLRNMNRAFYLPDWLWLKFKNVR